MRIISKFKDYYDYVSHIYGGGDNLNVYERKPIENNAFSMPSNLFDGFRFPSAHTTSKFKFKVIVIAGKLYTLRANQLEEGILEFGEYQLFTPENFPKAFTGDEDDRRSRWWSWYRKPKPEDYIGYEHPVLTEIAKVINQPVYELFKVTNHVKTVDIIVVDNIPVLADNHIPSIIKAEQLYQDIAYYTVNTMKDSPDVRKPDISSDKEKVLQHGFDAKQSFRHRK